VGTVEVNNLHTEGDGKTTEFVKVVSNYKPAGHRVRQTEKTIEIGSRGHSTQLKIANSRTEEVRLFVPCA
jgi:hypothetical protein